jgi:hypothetical protein
MRAALFEGSVAIMELRMISKASLGVSNGLLTVGMFDMVVA